MPITKVLVIYSKSQNVRRRLIKCGIDDSQYELHKRHVVDGEDWMEIPIELYNSFNANDFEVGGTVDIYIASILGNPKDDKCAVVNGETGEVHHLIHADPAIDDHPSGFLVQDDLQTGDIYDFETASVTFRIPEPEPVLFEPEGAA